MVLISENKFGLKAQSINDIAERLATINWYGKAGVKEVQAEESLHLFLKTLRVSEYNIQWVERERVLPIIGQLTFENSKLWEALRELPDQMKKKIDESGHVALLESTIEAVPQAVFHAAFEKAFQVFEDEKIVNYLVGHAMYIAVLICTAELADQVDLFAPLLELLASGHVPLGLEGNTIYLL